MKAYVGFMNVFKVFAWLGLIAMTAGLVNGFVQGDFFIDGGKLLQNPWGVMSLIDLYVGFVLFSLWIAFREKNVLVAAFWIVLMMVLGFFTASLYSLIVLYRCKGDWLTLFFGARREAIKDHDSIAPDRRTS